jgi:hypothetical protein
VVVIVNKNNLKTDGSACIILMIDPRGPRDLDSNAPPGFIVNGFHGSTEEVSDNDIPYCYCSVVGNNLTIDDKKNAYAQTLSHEIAEMVVDPFANSNNPEVCDACAGNCKNNWHSFFDNNNNYLDARRDLNQTGYTYYINAICKPDLYDSATECALKPRDQNDTIACKYPPPSPI